MTSNWHWHSDYCGALCFGGGKVLRDIILARSLMSSMLLNYLYFLEFGLGESQNWYSRTESQVFISYNIIR